jgi:hypothetical protein
VEFSALYRPSRQTAVWPFHLGHEQNAYLSSSVDKVNTWDFPLLLKYRFTEGAFRPYIGAGGAWSHRRSEYQAFTTCLGPQDSCRPPGYPPQSFGGL